MVAAGYVASPPTLEAYNIGDGTLSLTASVSIRAPWLSVSIGVPRQCTLVQAAGPCTPLEFTVDTSGLKSGTYTGEVTVSDPKAIDAPQSVLVTINVGGEPPFQIDQYVNPGATADVTAFSGYCARQTCPGSPSAITAEGGDWLSIAVDASGTFTLSWRSYKIHLAPRTNLAPGVYHGTVTASRPGIEQVIPVTMHVANGPIAVPSTSQINLRLAEGGPAVDAPLISLTNSGTGTLSVQNVVTLGAGLDAIPLPTGVALTIDPVGRAPGIYDDAAVLIACNAANCPLRIPISLEIVPRQAPVIQFEGIVDAGGQHDFAPAALGQIMLLNGEQLSTHPPLYSFPLSLALGGVSVFVNGKAAPLFSATSNQIAFQVPTDIAPGAALVQIQREGQLSNTVGLTVASVAPRIRAIISTKSGWVDSNHAATSGAALTLWASGLGPTSPQVAAGAPAPSQPLATVISGLTVLFDNATPLPFSAYLSPGAVGAYEVHVTLPPNLAPGLHSIAIFAKSSTTASALILVQ
jgi:uncharacterized protein (TIGR03437 family)